MNEDLFEMIDDYISGTLLPEEQSRFKAAMEADKEQRKAARVEAEQQRQQQRPEGADEKGASSPDVGTEEAKDAGTSS